MDTLPGLVIHASANCPQGAVSHCLLLREPKAPLEHIILVYAQLPPHMRGLCLHEENAKCACQIRLQQSRETKDETLLSCVLDGYVPSQVRADPPTLEAFRFFLHVIQHGHPSGSNLSILNQLEQAVEAMSADEASASEKDSV